MNVASLELCKELYKLSGWQSDWMYWKRLMDDYADAKVLKHGGVTTRDGAKICPAYDLGYLLRKLPREILVPKIEEERWLKIGSTTLDKSGSGHWEDMWEALYFVEIIHEVAHTPEDAAAKLAIELFKQGVLTPTQQKK